MMVAARTRVVGVIPARGGSKGLPRKNIRLLAGAPLIAHSIRAALQSSLLDIVVVSTEDQEIAEIAAAYGAKVVQRPASLATDTVQNTSVVRHVMEMLGEPVSHVVLLQPTSPLRLAADIDACLAPLLAGRARSVMTVTPAEHHPGKTLLLTPEGEATPFTCEADMEARRQDLPVVFRQNGAVYALGGDDFLASDRFILFPSRAHVMPPERSIDIDGEFDLFLAEKLIEQASLNSPST
jgi:CMP-N-acetylneuraminic acid synthetase